VEDYAFFGLARIFTRLLNFDNHAIFIKLERPLNSKETPANITGVHHYRIGADSILK